MARFTPRSFIVSAALTAVIWFVLIPVQVAPASAQSRDCDGECQPPPPPPAQVSPPPPPPVTGADSSGGSIGGLANQRFNQMIANRVLGTVLLGVNEQINPSRQLACAYSRRSTGSPGQARR